MVGGDGRQPAKDFSCQECGQVKFKYYCCKAFWDVVKRLVQGGLMAEVAIDRVYCVYGSNESVTTILGNMLKDWKNNTTPCQLQV